MDPLLIKPLILTHLLKPVYVTHWFLANSGFSEANRNQTKQSTFINIMKS